MTELGSRKNQGKPALELIPWADLEVSQGPGRIAVEDLYGALKVWFNGAPFPLQIQFPRCEILGVGAVLTFGSVKYAPRNWEKGLTFSSVFGCAARHAEVLAAGEILDRESGLPHVSHFWCNVLMLLVFTARGRTDLDDRPPAHPAIRERLDRLTALVAQTGENTVTSPGPNPSKPNGIN